MGGTISPEYANSAKKVGGEIKSKRNQKFDAGSKVIEYQSSGISRFAGIFKYLKNLTG